MLKNEYEEKKSQLEKGKEIQVNRVNLLNLRSRS